MTVRLYHTSKTMQFNCLLGTDVISAKVSDHHPVIHNNVLFWNVMMQAKSRQNSSGVRYNNGFGMIENDVQYCRRLDKIGLVIAEIIEQNPEIDVVTICEGPIQPIHIEHCMKSLINFNFKRMTMKDNKWGLYVLINQRYQYNSKQLELENMSVVTEKISERFILLELTEGNTRKYIALAHFPYGGDVQMTDRSLLSADSKMYAEFTNQLLHHFRNEQFMICADFNFNPYLLGNYQDRDMDQINHHNSILHDHALNTATVDGILLSNREKQMKHGLFKNHGLFSRLVLEHNLYIEDTAAEKCPKPDAVRF